MRSNIRSLVTQFYTYFDYVTCFLIALLILLPKVPFINVSGIYINIRIEDFIVAFFYGIWILGLILRQLQIPRTRLEFPFLLFLAIAFLSTIIGVLRHTIHPFLGLLYFFRYIEYFGIFFLILSSFKLERLSKYITILISIYVAVIIYGILNRFNIVPAYRTMGSAGMKLYFSQTSFVQSTFGGHYDFGAFVMMNTPLVLSLLAFEARKRIKIIYIMLLITSAYLMFYSFARSGYLGLLSALITWFILQKSWLLALPIFELFRIGYLYIEGKFSKYQYKFSITSKIPIIENIKHFCSHIASHLAYYVQKLKQGEQIANQVVGEAPAQASASSQITSDNSLSFGNSVQQKLDINNNLAINNDLQVSLDPSATIRFTAWKEHIKNDFLTNPLFGKGLSSIGVAADGDYIRWLSEMGVLGFAAFLYLFFSIFKMTYSVFKQTHDTYVKYIYLAFISLFVGLMVNALFIDIFESSKIAFYFWFMMGISVGYSIRKKEKLA